ncbi:MAG: phosphatidate cytidylyltransferase [Candidatus Helarchaeota archaeon]
MLGLFNFAIGVVLIICAIVFLKIAQLNAHNGQREGKWSGLLATITTLVIGIYFCGWGGYGLLNQDKVMQIGPFLPIPYPLAFYALAFLPVIIVFIGIYYLRERDKQKKLNSRSQSEKDQPIHPLDLEVSRKAFHITIIGILVCYLFLGKLAANAFFGYLETGWDIWHINAFLSPPAEFTGRAFALFMIVLIFVLLAFTDFVRLFKPEYYPIKMISNVYREKERQALGPHIHLAIGVLFAVTFFSPPIAMAVIAMAALGDAAATIVGINIGKHKINSRSKKTWEGCLGGIIVSFSTGFLCMIVLIRELNSFTILGALVLCGIGTLIFFLIDYYTPVVPLTDNIMNPLCIGLAMTGVAAVVFPSLLQL